MKRFVLLAALLTAYAIPSFGQSGSGYTFDNFDLSNGIKFEPAPAPVSETRRPLRTRKRGRADMRYSHANLPSSLAIPGSLDGYTTGDSNVDGFILDSAKKHGLDPLLIYAVMHQESSFKRKAISHKGARGLMQLMPPTARRFGVSSIFDPKQNIEGGARYLRFLLNFFDGDIRLALAGYNAGEGAVMKFGYRVPPYRETQEYVRRIGKRYALMRDPLTAGNANSLSRDQLAAMQQKEPTPLSIYEQSVFAVRLPDGKFQLVSQ